jgi:AcrR family transcriptional regulator
MTIPVTDSEPASGSAEAALGGTADRSEWTRLDHDGKVERLLEAATEVFARDGLDAPMSDVALAAGAGVASVYRLFPSKHDLLAALVAERMNQVAQAADAARAQDADRWSALTGLIASLVATQQADYLMGEAQVLVEDSPAVIESEAGAREALERLLAEARAEGRLRADATADDLRLLFAATRAAGNIAPEHRPRMLALMIDALDEGRSRR